MNKFALFTLISVMFWNVSCDAANTPSPASAKQANNILSLSADYEDNGKSAKLNFSVFDPDTNPVLIEFTIQIGTSIINFHEIEKFEVRQSKDNKDTAYTLHFHTSLFQDAQGNRAPYYKNIEFLPKTLTFSTSDPKIFKLQTIQGKWYDISDAKVKETNHLNFEPRLPLTDLNVREPSTPNAISYQQYFKPKGIDFPLIRQNGTRSAGDRPAANTGSNSSTFFSSSFFGPSIKSAEDLKLGQLLKDKKQAVWDLLQQKDKPTLAEFLKALGVKPAKNQENPFSEYARNSSLRYELENKFPHTVAQFRKAFPGAIWYALGRDIYLMGDALDAYYTHQFNSAGRVRRLHASQPSFDKNDIDEVIDFLKTNGFDFESMKEGSAPLVIFDITSYSKSNFRMSQSSQLMKAAYTEWGRLKQNPKNLLRKVNFVSVSHGSNNEMVTSSLDIDKFFGEMEFDPSPKKILRVDGPMSMQYSIAWHGLYTRFERKKDGNVVTSFGAPAPLSDKLAMLAELWDVAAVVMNKDFAAKVEEELTYLSNPSLKKASSTKSSSGLLSNNSSFLSGPCDRLLDKPIGSD